MYFRVIDTETCGLEGGIAEVASIDLVDDSPTRSRLSALDVSLNH